MKRARQTSGTLNRRLNMYCIAAGAAGVGVMAPAQPVQAQIVYTPANTLLESRSGADGYILNLNSDGIGEFFFHATWKRSFNGSGGFSRIFVIPAKATPSSVITAAPR